MLHLCHVSVFLIQTIGAAFVAKSISVGDKVITLGIWVSPVLSCQVYDFIYRRYNQAESDRLAWL